MKFGRRGETDGTVPGEAGPELADRVAALRRCVELARGRFDDAVVDDAARAADKAASRMRHGTHHTVVALAGPTGVGKSSVFNALAGAPVSTVGVRRPTTSATHAAVWGDDPANDLLDWLGVADRHHLGSGMGPDGLALLDLPDHDSVQVENRMEVDRLVELVDLLVWVADPQKYADQSLHGDYLRPLASHGPVLRFVLNQIDTVPEQDRPALVADFERRLAEDGLSDAIVRPMSVVTGDGIDAVRAELVMVVNERAAMVARLEADLRTAATPLRAGGGARERVPDAAVGTLVDGFERAARVERTAELAGQRHVRDATEAMGWPPTRWVARRRRNPLADLPRPERSALGSAEVDLALRAGADAAGDGLVEPWPTVLRHRAEATRDLVLTDLRTVTGRTVDDARTRPRWWAPVAGVQRILLATALVGLVWLVALVVLGSFLRLDTDALTPMVRGWIPLPTLLLLGGLGAGLAVAYVTRLPVRIAAARRARHVRTALRDELGVVARERVVTTLETALAERAELERAAAVAAYPAAGSDHAHCGA